jgi:hypothetical protein
VVIVAPGNLSAYLQQIIYTQYISTSKLITKQEYNHDRRVLQHVLKQMTFQVRAIVNEILNSIYLLYQNAANRGQK